MSAKIMGEVWGLDMPREQKYVLVALADHADHEGNHVYPSVGLIAWKTDYSERQVRRILTQLEAAGAIVPTDRQAGQTTEYRIDLSNVPRKTARNTKPGRPQKQANKPPDILTQVNKPPDTVSQTPGHFDTSTPDILTQTPGHFDTAPISLYETSLETSLETSWEGQENCADAPPPAESNSAEVAAPKQSPPKKTPLVHVAQSPPALTEIRDWLTSHGHDDCCAVAFLSHYGANGWMQGRGKPVYSWPHALAGWVEREKQAGFNSGLNNRGSVRPSAGGAAPLPPGVSYSEISKQKEIARVNALLGRK